jgi:hypothetical protein
MLFTYFCLKASNLALKLLHMCAFLFKILRECADSLTELYDLSRCNFCGSQSVVRSSLCDTHSFFSFCFCPALSSGECRIMARDLPPQRRDLGLKTFCVGFESSALSDMGVLQLFDSYKYITL